MRRDHRTFGRPNHLLTEPNYKVRSLKESIRHSFNLCRERVSNLSDNEILNGSTPEISESIKLSVIKYTSIELKKPQHVLFLTYDYKQGTDVHIPSKGTL